MTSTNIPVPSSTVSNITAPVFRQFTFFDVVPVKDLHDLDSPPDIFKAPLELSTVASSSVGVVVADIHGSVHILDSNLEPVQSWVAHVRGRVTHVVENRGMLLTMGEEDSVKHPILKIWDLSDRDKKTGTPVVLRSTEIKLSTRPHPVTAVALSSNFSHLAIGLGNGAVYLYRHLDQSLASSNSLTVLPKLRTVHEFPNEPITGLGFREPSTGETTSGHTNGDNTITNPNAATSSSTGMSLFVVTTHRVLSYQISGKNSGGPAIIVDEIGAALGCSTMDGKGRDIVIARSEAIYLCGTEGRGTCYAYEGSKSSIHTHLNYLVIVSPPIIPSVSAPSATIRNFAAARAPNAPETDVMKVTVFDPENKLVAYSGPFVQGVRQVVSQWGNIYILTNDGSLLCLQEKPTSAKLDMLYHKSLYPLALNVAKTQSLEDESVAEIYRYYGDHLYVKGDYDGAMAQYIHTIGHLQPSYVIRKYLDAQRINSLVNYLQELHNLGLANADHTTLLLNAYTKLKDVSRLDSFIRTESRRAKDGEDKDELPFDLDTAIRVCRQAGYYDHAAYLAKKYERHEDFLRIQVEDAGNYGDALKYLRKLGAEAAESNLARYGRALLEHLPEETTQLLIDLCTGPLLELEPPAVEGSQLTRQGAASAGPSYLTYLALNRASAVLPTVSSPDPNNSQPNNSADASTPTPPSPSIKTVKPDNASRRADSLYDAPGASTPQPPASGPRIVRPGTPAGAQHGRQHSGPHPEVIAPGPTLPKRLSPRIYFAHFVDHMDQFLKFLEAVATRRWKQSVNKIGSTMMNAKDRVTVSPYTPQDTGSTSETEFGNGAIVTVEGLEDEEEERLDQIAVWNTLLELYLTLKRENKKEEEELRENALKVLKSEGLPFDSTHALILCSTRGFTKGLVLLWEKTGMYEEVLRFWMDRHKEWESGAVNAGDAPTQVGDRASDKVVKCLEEYGDANRHLYPLVLRFLTSTPELLRRHEGDVKRILEVVDREGIIPPVGVVQVLSRNGVASVGLIKEWLMKRIKTAREEIKSDLELTKSYKAETATKLQQVATLSDPEHARVLHVTRCSACGGPIDLPVVHFMCDHSYHQRCLADQEFECPVCVREHGVIKEIRRNNERLADQHDVFKQEVQEGGFEAVATAFSRGFLNMNRTFETTVGAGTAVGASGFS